MATWKQIPEIVRLLVKNFGQRTTQEPAGPKYENKKETPGQTLTRVAPNALQHMPKPSEPAARPSEKTMSPQPELSVAEAAQAMRESLRRDTAAFRKYQLLEEKPASPAKAPDADRSASKSAATGFVPAADGKTSAPVEVDRDETTRGLDVSGGSTERKLNNNRER
ncbi:hypothetical protein [Embleya sp. NPDC001921]